jgi:hypothetical protein
VGARRNKQQSAVRIRPRARRRGWSQRQGRGSTPRLPRHSRGRGIRQDSSAGMYEHVGLTNLPAYFGTAARRLKPGGAFLNHGIVATNADGVAQGPPGGEFINRHIFFGRRIQAGRRTPVAEAIFRRLPVSRGGGGCDRRTARMAGRDRRARAKTPARRARRKQFIVNFQGQ